MVGDGLYTLVGQIVWVYTDEVGLWVLYKAHGFNIRKAEQKCFANAVHTVHHPAVTR